MTFNINEHILMKNCVNYVSNNYLPVNVQFVHLASFGYFGYKNDV